MEWLRTCEQVLSLSWLTVLVEIVHPTLKKEVSEGLVRPSDGPERGALRQGDSTWTAAGVPAGCLVCPPPITKLSNQQGRGDVLTLSVTIVQALWERGLRVLRYLLRQGWLQHSERRYGTA